MILQGLTKASFYCYHIGSCYVCDNDGHLSLITKTTSTDEDLVNALNFYFKKCMFSALCQKNPSELQVHSIHMVCIWVWLRMHWLFVSILTHDFKKYFKKGSSQQHDHNVKKIILKLDSDIHTECGAMLSSPLFIYNLIIIKVYSQTKIQGRKCKCS